MKVSASDPNFGGKVPHLMCGKGDIADIVLLPGDPGRVAMFASLFDRFEIIASNREYTVGTGEYQGRRISVCSTGIGAPSTEIAVVELVELGAKALIRVGGTGVLQKEIACGDLVINTAAVRQGGSSIFYAPPEYPAVASHQVVTCLLEAGEKRGKACWTGISASIGSFFAGQGRPAAGIDFNTEDVCEKYKRLNVINMEMESETILTLGSLFGVYTGCVCAVHANRETDEWLYDFEPAQREMCLTALDASVLLYERYLDKAVAK